MEQLSLTSLEPQRQMIQQEQKILAEMLEKIGRITEVPERRLVDTAVNDRILELLNKIDKKQALILAKVERISLN